MTKFFFHEKKLIEKIIPKYIKMGHFGYTEVKKNLSKKKFIEKKLSHFGSKKKQHGQNLKSMIFMEKVKEYN